MKNKRAISKMNTIEVMIIVASVTVLYFVMLIMKGCYPFGDNAFIFIGDGYQQNLATLYYVWDYLHGYKSAFYNFGIGYGSNMTGILLHFGMLSPINLIYLFVPRTGITESTIFTTFLRMVLAGLSMRYYLRSAYKEKLSSLYVIFLSLMYCYSSWLLRYIGFFQWIDVAIILPVCIAMLRKLLCNESRKYRLRYVLSLSLIMIINIQQSFAILIFIMLYSLFFLLYNFEIMSPTVKNTMPSIFRLGFFTVISMLLSAVIFLPAAYQVSTSARVSRGNIIYQIKQIIRSCFAPDTSYYSEKLVIFDSCFILLVAMIIIGVLYLVAKHFEKKLIFVYIFSAIMVIPVFIEAVHYIWQGGEYMSFPLRMGETIVFTLITMLAELLFVGCNCRDGKLGKHNELFYFMFLITVPFWLISIYNMTQKHIVTGDINAERDMYYYANELNDLYESPQILYKNLGFTNNVSITSGLSFGSNYMHLMTSDNINTNKLLGYRQNWTRISDEGGTVFSDALLGYDYAVSNVGGLVVEPIDNTYPFGIFVNKDVLQDYMNSHDEEYDNIVDLATYRQEDTNVFEVQNEIAKIIIGKELFSNFNSIKVNGESRTIEYTSNIEESSIYIMFRNLGIDDYVYIGVNGDQSITIPNGIVNLGVEDKVIIEVPEGYEGVIDIATFDNKTFEKTTPEGVVDNIIYKNNSLSFTVSNDSNEEQILFIPISYDKGWSYKINGKTVNAIKIFGTFTALQIPENSIVNVNMRYSPPFMIIGAILSILGILLLVIDFRYDISSRMINKVTASFASLAYYGILTGLIMFMLLLVILTLFH